MHYFFQRSELCNCKPPRRQSCVPRPHSCVPRPQTSEARPLHGYSSLWDFSREGRSDKTGWREGAWQKERAVRSEGLRRSEREGRSEGGGVMSEGADTTAKIFLALSGFRKVCQTKIKLQP